MPTVLEEGAGGQSYGSFSQEDGTSQSYSAFQAKMVSEEKSKQSYSFNPKQEQSSQGYTAFSSGNDGQPYSSFSSKHSMSGDDCQVDTYSNLVPKHSIPDTVSTSQFSAGASPYNPNTSQYSVNASQYNSNASQYNPNTSQYSSASQYNGGSQYTGGSSQFNVNASQYASSSSQYSVNAAQYGSNVSQYGSSASSQYISTQAQYGSYGDVDGSMVQVENELMDEMHRSSSVSSSVYTTTASAVLSKAITSDGSNVCKVKPQQQFAPVSVLTSQSIPTVPSMSSPPVMYNPMAQNPLYQPFQMDSSQILTQRMQYGSTTNQFGSQPSFGYGLSQPVTQVTFTHQPATQTYNQQNLFLPPNPQSDIYSNAYRAPDFQPSSNQNALLISSGMSSLTTPSVKVTQSSNSYGKGGAPLSGLGFGQGNALQPSQMFIPFDPTQLLNLNTPQNLSTSPLLGSQLVQSRPTAVQNVHNIQPITPPTSFYNPGQTSAFFQQGSALQNTLQQMTMPITQTYTLPTFGSTQQSFASQTLNLGNIAIPAGPSQQSIPHPISRNVRQHLKPVAANAPGSPSSSKMSSSDMTGMTAVTASSPISTSPHNQLGKYGSAYQKQTQQVSSKPSGGGFGSAPSTMLFSQKPPRHQPHNQQNPRASMSSVPPTPTLVMSNIVPTHQNLAPGRYPGPIQRPYGQQKGGGDRGKGSGSQSGSTAGTSSAPPTTMSASVKAQHAAERQKILQQTQVGVPITAAL